MAQQKHVVFFFCLQFSKNLHSWKLPGVVCTWWVWFSPNWIQNKGKTVNYAQFQAAWPVAARLETEEQNHETSAHQTSCAERKRAGGRGDQRRIERMKCRLEVKKKRVSGGQFCQCTDIPDLSKALMFVGLGAIRKVHQSLKQKKQWLLFNSWELP